MLDLINTAKGRMNAAASLLGSWGFRTAEVSPDALLPNEILEQKAFSLPSTRHRIEIAYKSISGEGMVRAGSISDVEYSVAIIFLSDDVHNRGQNFPSGIAYFTESFEQKIADDSYRYPHRSLIQYLRHAILTVFDREVKLASRTGQPQADFYHAVRESLAESITRDTRDANRRWLKKKCDGQLAKSLLAEPVLTAPQENPILAALQESPILTAPQKSPKKPEWQKTLVKRPYRRSDKGLG